MNVYDFDGTIYDGDSTRDFYFYCLKKYPVLLFFSPYQLVGFLAYFLNIISKTQAKQRFYSFLSHIKDIDEDINIFWNKNRKKIKQWYIRQQKSDDVIISASPEFLIVPICEKLGIKNAMASPVDKKTGKYSGENCHGEEKVRRFYERFPGKQIQCFYSDSLHDAPLARIAEYAYFVKKNDIKNWKG